MAPSLDLFAQELRDYQEAAVAHASLLVADGTPRAMFASPTGTGKGTIELALLRDLRRAGREAIILTPALDVVKGFVERCAGRDLPEDLSEDRLSALGESLGIFTPVRYRNQVLQGEAVSAEVFIVDEAHHNVDSGDVAGLLFALAPEAQWVGFTATPFRGSPKGTRELREVWGEPWVVLTVPEAIERGACQLPDFSIVPLVDDDRIKVVNGQFQVASADREVGSRVGDLVKLAGEEVVRQPTVLVVPSTDVARLVVEHAREHGTPGGQDFEFVGAHSTQTDRARAFARAKEREAVLVTIAVLREGVDLPWLRTMVDAAPTLSPVVWAQRVGRIMRPGPDRPRYLCTCRNLERHAYVLQGAVPRFAIAEAQQAFMGPSKIAAGRVIGLEALKRFKQIPIPLTGGLWCSAYVLYSSDGEGHITQYVSILHPAREEPVTASRVNVVSATGEMDWGNWSRCEVPEDLVGFSSVPSPKPLSDKQKKWWRSAAQRRGLDAGAADKLTSRQFFVLPVLEQLREKL